MATLHIRDLKDSVKESIRIRAAVHGRSMEAEARAILEQAAGKQEPEATRTPRAQAGGEVSDRWTLLPAQGRVDRRTVHHSSQSGS